MWGPSQSFPTDCLHLEQQACVEVVQGPTLPFSSPLPLLGWSHTHTDPALASGPCRMTSLRLLTVRPASQSMRNVHFPGVRMGGRRRRQPRGLDRSPGSLGPWVTRRPGAWWGGWRRPEEWSLSECVWSSASPTSCPLQAAGLLPQDRGWAPAAFITHQGECSGQSTYHMASHPGFGLSLPQERETLGQEHVYSICGPREEGRAGTENRAR